METKKTSVFDNLTKLTPTDRPQMALLVFENTKRKIEKLQGNVDIVEPRFVKADYFKL